MSSHLCGPGIPQENFTNRHIWGQIRVFWCNLTFEFRKPPWPWPNRWCRRCYSHPRASYLQHQSCQVKHSSKGVLGMTTYVFCKAYLRQSVCKPSQQWLEIFQKMCLKIASRKQASTGKPIIWHQNFFRGCNNKVLLFPFAQARDSEMLGQVGGTKLWVDQGKF